MSKAATFLVDPPAPDDRPSFDTIHKHGHQDLVQAVAFNGHGDRCATGSVDGKIRVFNRHKDGAWRLCDTWGAHASEILELQWLPTTIYPNLLASLGIEGRFKLWAEDPSAAPGRRFAESTRNGPLITIPSRSPHLHANGTSTPGGASASASNLGLGSPAPPAIHPSSSTLNTPAIGYGDTAIINTPSTTAALSAKPAFETRNARSPYRSFSLKHLDDSRTTYLALLSADGGLTVYENDRVENLAAFTLLDELSTTDSDTTTTASSAGTDDARGGGTATLGGGAGGTTGRRPPATRGEETSFRVRFDPNPEVCYTALRAGVPSDALGLVVAAMDRVRVYRTRDTVRTALGVAAAWKGFYLAAEVRAGSHRGLVRDVAWAPGNIRGYDIVATACQDGFVRVFRLDALLPGQEGEQDYEEEGEEEDDEDDDDEFENGDGISRARSRSRKNGPWSAARVKKHGATRRTPATGGTDSADDAATTAATNSSSGIRAGLDQSRGGNTPNPADRTTRKTRPSTLLLGQVRHTITEISKLDCHRTPVWRVGFDDDGQILGSVGDEGKLMCYRQKPDGAWAKSTEMAMVKMKMAEP